MGSKGEVAFLDSGDHRYPTLVAYTGEDEGATIIGKMRFTHDIIFYVDASSGEDSIVEGRGFTADKPWKTLPFAWAYMAKNVAVHNSTITIHLAPGEYSLFDNVAQVPSGASFVIFDGKNDNSNDAIIKTDTNSSTGGYAFQSGNLIFRNIHFRGNGYATLNSSYNNIAILANCIIENTAIDSDSHSLLYAWDDGYFRIDPPVKFIAKGVTGFLAILHATRRGGIQISTTEPRTFTFDVHNASDIKFLFCTKAGSIVTPAEASFTVSGDVSNIDAVQVGEGGLVSGHGMVYNSQPASQPTVADVLGAGTKAVALAAMDETDEVVYEPDIAYMERQRFFAELDEEYRRVGILSD